MQARAAGPTRPDAAAKPILEQGETPVTKSDSNTLTSLARRRLLGLVPALAFAALVALPGPTTPWAKDHKTSLGVPGVRGGIVTTSEPAAAKVGAEILRRGGNAIDAAAAVQFALNVIEPQSSGIGGGGFMIVHLAESGETVVVDSRERTPAAGDPEMFLQASDGNPFPFSIRSTSGIGVGVPGTVRGVATALETWGTLSLAEVLQPAIDMAEKGIQVSSRLEDSITSSRLDSEPGNPAYEEARDVFRPGGTPLVEGDVLVQPDLAKTLKLLADQGADAFYTGPLAQAIVATQLNTRTVADAADQAKLVGRMTLDDLATYEVALRQPVEGEYRGFRIVSMPPPSSGGLTVIQILKMLERFPLGDESEGFGFGSTRTLNVMIEAMRLAFADRAVWMGDEDFVDVPSTGLLSDDYIALRSALINPDARQPAVSADDPRPFDTAALPADRKVRLAAVDLPDEEGLNTTHFTVADSQGNVVTYTSTIESAWGTGLMVPGFGFLLNNELTDFNSRPTFDPDPANFNPGANDPAAFKRPRSSMAPTMVFKNKKPLAAFGSPGGSSIINTVAQVAMNLIDHRMTVQEAVDQARLTTTGGSVFLELFASFPPESVADLAALGHPVSGFRFGSLGSVQAVVVDRRGQRLFGAADKRRIGGIVSLRVDQVAAE